MAAIVDRKDPLSAFRFRVEIDGIHSGGFTEVTGLQAETEFEEYREGGVNDHVHRFPKATKYPPLVLKRGITLSTELWDWYKNTIEGSISRRDGSIILMNNSGKAEIYRWNFFGAYPVKWAGPELKSSGNEIAVERLEIVHNGIKSGQKQTGTP